ncbi:hypothetical protein [Laspinema olomoucense]|uniref:hypothetical protein n=1 Tax=Laspinema olomoucense TaxID=3231600 RepID=UPI0021BB7D6E|nr:hypothetical protein [Laspinema sp. D3a]MCT7988243.1 hypothetical protein [Laspinema sp. D3a]
MKSEKILFSLVLMGLIGLIAPLGGFNAAEVTGQGLGVESATLMAKGDRQMNLDNVPRGVQSAVISDLSRRQNIPERQIRITEATRQTWPDSCLGLSGPNEFCSQVRTEGWRLVLTENNNRWVYRTDENGRTVRLESGQNATSTELPRSVSDAVLQAVSSRGQMSINNFRIVKAVRQTWPDGCLGVPQAGTSCTQARVEGWEVTVISDRAAGQRWIYRTDNSGRTVVLSEAYDGRSSLPRSGPNPVLQPGTNRPVPNSSQIPPHEMPQPLTQGIIFRAISSGGIAGQTYETVLMNNGTLMQVLQGPGNANDSGRRVGRISPREVQEFRRLLSQQQFDRYNGLNVSPSGGSADYITVILSSRSSTIRYADISQQQLPSNLQPVIQSWNRIVSQIGR